MSSAPTVDVSLASLVAWDGDRLVVTDPALIERLRRPALSPSTAKAMTSCVARWAVEKAMPEIDNPFGAAELGTAGHAVMEDLFNLPFPARTPEKAMSILLGHSKTQWPGQDEATFAQRGMWIAAVATAYQGLWDIENPQKVTVRETEMKFGGSGPDDHHVEIDGIPVIGYIDRVDQVLDENNEPRSRIVDYKTGKVPKNITRYGDDHGDQMRIYAKILELIDGRMPVEAVLYYTKFGQKKAASLSPTSMSKTLRSFTNSWKTLNTVLDEGAFPTKTSALCGWCPVVNSCPVAAAEGKVDRTDAQVASSAVDLGIPTLRKYEDVQFSVPDHGFDHVPDFPADAPSSNAPAYVPDHAPEAPGTRPPNGAVGEPVPVVPGPALFGDFVPPTVPVPTAVHAVVEPPQEAAVDDPYVPLAADDFGQYDDFDGPGGFDGEPQPTVQPTVAVPAQTTAMTEHGEVVVVPVSAVRAPAASPTGPTEFVTEPAAATPVTTVQPTVQTSVWIEETPLGAAVPVAEVGPSAHGLVETTSTSQETPMTNPGDPATPYLFGDDRPYHERVGDHLNAASYAATGVFGLASLAYEELARREQPINRETVDALTKTLTLVVKRAQGELSGSSSFQHGLNTRLRGALRTVVEVNPLPFGEPTAAWTGWINRAIGHTKSIAKAAHRAYEWDGKGEPWKTLAVDPAPVHVEVDEFAA